MRNWIRIDGREGWLSNDERAEMVGAWALEMKIRMTGIIKDKK